MFFMGGFFMGMNNLRIRLLLFVVVILAALYCGLFLFSSRQAVAVFREWGYWTMGASFLLFFYALYRAYGASLPALGCYFRSRAGVIGLVVAILGSIFLHRAEPWEFKTVMDEHTLAMTAKRMHESREVESTTRALSLNGGQVPLRGYVDKRPIAQPFLVSLLHDLTGFRPYNGVALNIVLTPFLLLLLYVITQRLANIPAAAAAVALFCSLPLVSYMCAGGGLEPLNLFFILLTWFLGGLYLEKSSNMRLAAFLFSAVLLAQCRYESILFVIPVGLVVMWSWWRDRRLNLAWPLYLCPLLLVPYLWQHQVFSVSSHMWQMDDVKRSGAPFGIDYMHDNLGRAVGFFFDFSQAKPNSWLLVGAGLVALLLLLVRGLSRRQQFRELPGMAQAGLWFLPGFLILFLLLLGYGWEFDNIVIRRLSLPLHLPLAVAAGYLFFYFFKARWVHRASIAAIALYFMAVAFPVTSKRIYSKNYVAGLEFAAAREFIKENAGQPKIIIADNAAFFIIFGEDGLSTALANRRKEAIQFFLDQPNSPPLYYFQRQVYEPTTGEFRHSSKGLLDEAFTLETVWEKPISGLRRVCFARVVGVEGVEVEPQEYESVQDYLEVWAKNLP